MQMRGAGPFSAPAWGLLPAILALAFTGCTMCPDPHDYSGPVPNGSPPQNDFRARSNGILPIGAAPHPWPTLVKKSSGDPRGPAGGGRLAKGEVKQLSAEKLVVAPEARPPEEAAEDAGEQPVTASSAPTRNTVAVIGEADEDVQDGQDLQVEGQNNTDGQEEFAEENAPSVPESDETAADDSQTDPAAEETTPAPGPAPVPPLPDDGEPTSSSEQTPAADAVPPQSEPETPAAEEPAAEPEAAEPPLASKPRVELRETPGWRPRQSLNPALYGR